MPKLPNKKNFYPWNTSVKSLGRTCKNKKAPEQGYSRLTLFPYMRFPRFFKRGLKSYFGKLCFCRYFLLIWWETWWLHIICGPSTEAAKPRVKLKSTCNQTELAHNQIFSRSASLRSYERYLQISTLVWALRLFCRSRSLSEWLARPSETIPLAAWRKNHVASPGYLVARAHFEAWLRSRTALFNRLLWLVWKEIFVFSVTRAANIAGKPY